MATVPRVFPARFMPEGAYFLSMDEVILLNVRILSAYEN
jgi:hypothetical protein